MAKRAKAKPEDIVDFTTEEGLPMWTPDSIIRNRETGRPMLVVRVFQNATFLIELGEKTPNYPLVLLPKDYRDWAREIDGENENDTWHYHPVEL